MVWLICYSFNKKWNPSQNSFKVKKMPENVEKTRRHKKLSGSKLIYIIQKASARIRTLHFVQPQPQQEMREKTPKKPTIWEWHLRRGNCQFILVLAQEWRDSVMPIQSRINLNGWAETGEYLRVKEPNECSRFSPAPKQMCDACACVHHFVLVREMFFLCYFTSHIDDIQHRFEMTAAVAVFVHCFAHWFNVDASHRLREMSFHLWIFPMFKRWPNLTWFEHHNVKTKKRRLKQST